MANTDLNELITCDNCGIVIEIGYTVKTVQEYGDNLLKGHCPNCEKDIIIF